MKITLFKTNSRATVEVTEGNIYSLKFDHILLEDGKYLFNGEVFSPLGSSTEILPFTVMNWCTSLELVSRAKYQVPDVSVLHSFVKPLAQAGSQKELLFEQFFSLCPDHCVEEIDWKKLRETIMQVQIGHECTKPQGFEEFEFQCKKLKDEREAVMNELNTPKPLTVNNKQLNELAKELFTTYQDTWLKIKGVGNVFIWEKLPVHEQQAWVELAKKYSQPTSDLQQQLDDALKSERELMGYLRDIGKVFNMNVGTDIGAVELAGFIEKKVNSYIRDAEKYRKLKPAKPGPSLIQVIKDHNELHDLITHLHDFKTAVEFYHEATQFYVRDFDESDQSYWEKQVRTVNRLIELTK